MKGKINLLFVFTLIISGCSIKKLVELEQYNYAIDRAVGKLNRKPNDFETYDLLQKSYAALEAEKLENIERSLNKTNPNWEDVFKNYKDLQSIQQKVNQLKFHQSKIEFQSIDKDFESTKQVAAQNKFNEATFILKSASTKEQYQKAYYLLKEVKELNPNKEEIDILIYSCKNAGTTKVVFNFNNPNRYEFPDSFYDQLKAINLSDFNDDWITFYPAYLPSKKYDYTLNVTFNKFNIQNKETVIFSYNDRKTIIENEDRKEVTAKVERTKKYHSIYIKGELQLIDNLAMNTFEMYPLQAFYNWQNEGAKYTGDKRALSPKSLDLLYVPYDEAAQYKSAFVASAKDITEDVKLYLFYVGHKLENKPKPNLFE